MQTVGSYSGVSPLVSRVAGEYPNGTKNILIHRCDLDPPAIDNTTDSDPGAPPPLELAITQLNSNIATLQEAGIECNLWAM